MKASDTEEAADFGWGALAAKVLHPIQIEIIEALRWVDLPLSAAELVQIFEGRRIGLRIERHLRRLAKIGAVELAAGEGESEAAMVRSYRLVEQPPA